MAIKQTLSTYYYLTKPGIVYGNAITAFAGYFFGANGVPSFPVFAAMLVGICAVMASACVYNNVIDRDIDARMERTKRRAVATGQVSALHALVFANLLLIFGVIVLALGTNTIATLVAIAGHVAYVVLYGYAKRKTVHGTLVGTLSGSTPPVIGYVAATGSLDLTALLLFVILAAWQMPHFYAIAIFRRDDYASAGIPVLPVVKGLDATRRQIILYVILFVIACVLLGLYGGASLLWTMVMVLLGGYWLYLCAQRVLGGDINRWARRQFGWSLSVLLVMSIGLSVDSFLH
jgi:protoheme IX farnesyltransferase